MAEFAWDILEPEEGRYEFGLFDETIAAFGAKGIRTILCTPTAAPPRWLTAKYPEVLREDENGRRLFHGSRQHASHFSPVFREFSRRITRAMAEHFAGNPQVIGWQTDNEFHCHFSEDHSPAAARAFICFLESKYATIDALNCAWGTAFWAQTYRAFAEIETPRAHRPTWSNPAQELDYRRFLSDGVVAFQREQVGILRTANPRWWITHNGFFKNIDYAGAFAEDLDFLGYDSYPFFDLDPARRMRSQAFNLDHARSYGGNLLILEQQSGPGGQGHYLHDTPEPGEMRRMVWSSIARGADGILLFRERSCRFGAEQYWCGVLDHDNIPRRRYREAAQIGAELARVGARLLGTSVEVDIGIATGDFDAQHGHHPISHGLPCPKQSAETIHGYFFSRGHAVGCIHPSSPLDGVKVFFIPHMAVLNPAYVANWTGWVQAGGTLVIGARTATRNLENNVHGQTPPGPLRELAGVEVLEYGRQNRPDRRPLPMVMETDRSQIPTDRWYEALAPAEGTEIVATWGARHLRSLAAITLRRLGRGQVLYVGTWLDDPVLASLHSVLQSLGKAADPVSHHPEVEQVQRSGPGGSFRFFINHAETEIHLPLACGGLELLSDQPVLHSVKLEPNGVAIVEQRTPCCLKNQ
jgi:beta-galactosidase